MLVIFIVAVGWIQVVQCSLVVDGSDGRRGQEKAEDD